MRNSEKWFKEREMRFIDRISQLELELSELRTQAKELHDAGYAFYGNPKNLKYDSRLIKSLANIAKLIGGSD